MKKLTILVGGFLGFFACIIMVVAATGEYPYSSVVTELDKHYDTLEYPSDYLLKSNMLFCTGITGSPIRCIPSTKYEDYGLINESEFDIAGGYRSYLVKTYEFFTMTEEDNEVLLINHNSRGFQPFSYSSTIRPTTLILPDTKVTGTGSYSNPFMFIPRETTVTVNAVNGVVQNNNIKKLYKGENVAFEVSPNDNYRYDSNTNPVTCTGTYDSIKYENNYLMIYNVTNDIECSIEFQKMSHIVTVSVPNAAVTPASKEIEHGGNATFTITPNTGYTLDNATVSCTEGLIGMVADNTLTIPNVTSEGTCTVTLNLKGYKVSLALTNGSAIPSTANVVHGQNVSMLVLPNTNYQYSTSSPVTCTGTYGSMKYENNYLTLTNVGSNVNCTFNFQLKTYNVTASVPNAVVSPSTKAVGHGGSTTFTITPNAGYNVNGATVSCPAGITGSISGSTLTVTNVTTAGTCTVTIPKYSYSVSLTVSGGSASPTSAVVQYGGSASFTIYPSTNYTTSGATVSCTAGRSGSISGSTLTMSNVTSAGSCTVTLPMSCNPNQWSACMPGASTYCNGCYATYNSGYMYNGCGETVACTPNIDCTTMGGIIGQSASCGYGYIYYGCGGSQYTYLGTCGSPPSCNLYMSPTSFRYNYKDYPDYMYGVIYSGGLQTQYSWGGFKYYCQGGTVGATNGGLQVGAGHCTIDVVNTTYGYLSLSVYNNLGSNSCGVSYSVYR